MDTIRFKVADLVYAAFSDHPGGTRLLEDSYKDFICHDVPDVSVYGHYSGFPDLALKNRIKAFESGVFWDVYRGDGDYVFVLKIPSNLSPYYIAVFDTDFKKGDVYYSREFTVLAPDDRLLCPLAYPLFHLLMISFLAEQGYGVLIHACGIDDDGRGYLFPGSSSHGKTTMATLWQDKALVLNDERIIIRKQEGHLCIYGTPWHGEYESVSPHGVPIEKIFFLSHAKENSVRYLKGTAAASKILSHCSIPYWNSAGMNFIVDFCSQVVSEIPCYELDFVPDEDIVDFVRCVK
jgi:hypothetical protein